MNDKIWAHSGDARFLEPDDLWQQILPKKQADHMVYASFQHDESARAGLWAMGYQNVMFGRDDPHPERTFGHTQKTLHELFDDVGVEVRRRITRGPFEDLFPQVEAGAA